MIAIRSQAELDLIRESGAILVDCIKRLEEMLRPDVTTGELDRTAEELIRSRGAEPAFKGYQGYPASICTSVNEQVVHGLPSSRRLKEGDILSLDMGAVVDGYYGDAAITVPVGRISAEADRLLRVTRECLDRAIAAAGSGARLADISGSVQEHAEHHGFSVVRVFVGHGIGKELHEAPQIPNFVEAGRGRGPVLKPGMVLAIEPMVNAGRPEVKVLEDKWTAVTVDGSLSAHFEHTVAITENGTEILTAPEGTRCAVGAASSDRK